MSWQLKRKLYAAVLWTLAIAPWCWVGSVFGREFLMQRELEQLQGQVAQLEADLQTTSDVQPLSAEQQRLELMKWKLLSDSDIAGTMHALESVAQDVGVDLISIRSPTSSENGLQLFDVTGRGAPEQICSWFAEVENHERLVVVESGSVGPSIEGSVAFEVRLATHHEGGRR